MRIGSCPARQGEAGVLHKALPLPTKHYDTCKELARAGEPGAGCKCSFQDGCERRGAWFDLAEGEMSAAKEARVRARSWEVGHVSPPVSRSQKLKCLCLRNVCLSFIPHTAAPHGRESKLGGLVSWMRFQDLLGCVSASKGGARKRTGMAERYFH